MAGLSNELISRGPDRRQSPRFPLPIGQVFGSEVAEVTLLNISRHGMSIEVPLAAALARGDSHCFTLQDLNHSVEVQGKVFWVRSDWRERGAQGGVQYFKVAGLGFEKILTDRPGGIWSNLRPCTIAAALPEPSSPPVRHSAGESSSRVASGTHANFRVPVSVSSNRPGSSTASLPPTLIVPLDGSSLNLASLTVVCRVSRPEEVTLVNINGVRADLKGGQAAAEITLKPGINRLSALICRDDGSYRTYSLGTVTRKELT